MPTTPIDKKGIIFSISACTLFALLPAYVQLLQPLSGYVAAGQRILWSSIILGLTLLIRGELLHALKPLTQWRAWPGLLLGSLLIGAQWWVFIWAPMNGHTLDVSLGYFLLPLIMVLIGRFFFNERLHPLQWLAVFLASLAVVWMYHYAGGISWVTLLICLGYPLYFILRRIQTIKTLSIFFIENILLLPIAFWAINYFGGASHPFSYTPHMILLFAGLGLLGSIPMLCFIEGSRRLPISIFGLINYLEPTLIFIIGYLILDESLSTKATYAYLTIMLALIILSLDSLKRSKYNFTKADLSN